MVDEGADCVKLVPIVPIGANYAKLVVRWGMVDGNRVGCRLCQTGATIGRFCNHQGDTSPAAAWYRTQYFDLVFGGKHILISSFILNQTQIFESIWSTETVSQRHVFWIPNNVVTVCFDSDIVIISINFSTGDDTWPAPQTGGKNCDNSSQRIKKEPGRETCLLFALLISLLHLHFVREQNNSYSSQRGRSIFYLHYWFLSAKTTPHQQYAIHLY